MNMDDYVKAGGIASEIREAARKKDWVGRTVYEICEEIEGQIRERGGKPAFPVNTSINETAAHYTAEPGDELAIAGDDLVKIDLGVQINGYIADTAVTVNYDPRFDYLVAAAEDALAGAMSIVRDGVKASDIGRAIEKKIKQHGGKPIVNLSGHSLDRYTIHAGRSIPNIWAIGSFSLSGSSAYACEPFVTTPKGLGFVREGKTRNIYAMISRKKTKDAEADRLLDFIWDSFNMLPFALRWITGQWEEKRARELLETLIRKKAVRAYPVLIEANGQRVAQAEHTFIPSDDGAKITTMAR